MRYSRGSGARFIICAGAMVLYAAAVANGQVPATSARPAAGQEADAQALRQELDRLRKEFDAIRDEYGARLAALEAKLAAMEPAPAQPPAGAPAGAPPGQVPVPTGATGAGGPTGSLPVYGGTSALSKIFNPDIAVIGNFLGAVGENDVNPAPAFEMDEAEATFQAIVDPYARADFFFAFSPEGVEIEEGFLTFPTLPGGLLAKVGKFKQQFGKANTLHPHQRSWIDQPIALENLLGGEEGLNDSGISVSRLVLNPWIFLEAKG